MSDPFPPPGDQSPPPPPGSAPPPYGYQQQGYGYSYGPTYTYSGFWRRVAAYFIDGVVLSVPLMVLGAIAGTSGFVTGANYNPSADVALNILSSIAGVAYYAVLEGTRGQTLGKMAVGIKVVDGDTAGFIGIPRGVGRYFARILSGLALGLGYLWMLWDPRKQTWHDKLVRSVVVRTQ